MSELSEKYYSNNELLIIAKQKQIPEKYFEDFISFIEKDIQQLTDDAEMSEDDIKTSTIYCAVEYFKKFEAEMQKGHSKEWSHVYAISIEDHPHAFDEAYTAIKEIDPVQAKEELMIHCKAMGGDDLYTKHFIFLMEIGEALSDPDKQAASYSNIYKQQIALGKSEVFAHEYADLIAADEFVEIYCYWYAKAYDDCIQKGKSKEYAEMYAHKIGDYYSDYYGRYAKDETIDKENHDFQERMILGYMNAWEYVSENKLNHGNKFIEFYENIYINSYFPDDRVDIIDEKELDKNILERALKKFNHYIEKMYTN